jgi:sugar lactone lactonase YvrE
MEIAMRRVLAAALVVAFALPAAPAGAHPPGMVSGFQYDESVWWDGETGSFYVTNFGGSSLDPNGRDPDGYITKLSGEGRVRVDKWVTGLRSPKGMRRSGDFLYVADVGQLAVVDVAAGTVAGTVDLDALGAKFPNDVAVDEATGDVYVSDTLANAIYRVPAGTRAAQVWLASPDLEAPNGLLVDGGRLLVAAYGRDLDPATFQPGQTGRVLVVDLTTKAISPLGGMGPVAQLDGIEKQDDSYLVTDDPGGRLLRIGADGSVTELITGLTTPADIGWRAGDSVVAVPELSASDVKFATVPGSSPAVNELLQPRFVGRPGDTALRHHG